MQKIIYLLIAICITASIATARPYLSATPVDNGSFAFPEGMGGFWTVEKEQFGITYKVIYNPNKIGHINISIQLGPMMPGILSKINDHVYLSLYDEGGKGQPKGYYIYRLVIESDEEVRLIPLRNDIDIPSDQTLHSYLTSIKDPTSIEENYVIWLSNNYKKASKKELNTAGRTMNIKKKPSPTK